MLGLALRFLDFLSSKNQFYYATCKKNPGFSKKTKEIFFAVCKINNTFLNIFIFIRH